MNTTTQQDTQAAANKAAEEGGLPALRSALQMLVDNKDVRDNITQKELDKCRAALDADRASRQVANKAEVEPTNWRAKCEALIDIWDDAQANPPESRCYVENAWPEIIEELRAALATPPATTGASTAQANGYLNVIENLESQLAECMKVTHKWASYAGDADGRALKAEEEVLSLHRQLAAEKLRADQGWERGEAKSRECLDLRERMAGSVGASTVLTDERTSIDTPEFRFLLIAAYHDIVTEDKYGAVIAHIDQHVAHEVAAQAGQVAVPDPTLMGELRRWAGDDPGYAACLIRMAVAEIERIAAPSPAKESK